MNFKVQDIEHVLDVIDNKWHKELLKFINAPNKGNYSGLRIGFGGSATNPAHLGHLAVLQLILGCGLFDHIYWIPSGSSNKPGMGETFVDHTHRLQMAQLAMPQYWLNSPAPGWAKLFIDPTDMFESEIPTAVRFWMFRLAFPGALIYFYTGSDAVTFKSENKNCQVNYQNLPIYSWEYPELLAEEQIYICAREGYAQPEDTDLPANMNFIETPKLPNYQSSVIRQLIRDNDPSWVPMVRPEIADYIRLHNLYR